MNHIHCLTPDWNAPKRIKAYTTLRTLELCVPATHPDCNTRDYLKARTRNSVLLQSQLDLPKTPICLQQVHGAKAVSADNLTGSYRIQADTLYTDTPDNICTILTADCLPILLCHQEGEQVAAIHAGWRGLAAGIIENTLAALHKPSSEWMAWLGPAIGPCAFEVGECVRDRFVQSEPHLSDAFRPRYGHNTKTGHNGKYEQKWFADIYSIAKQKLKKQAVTQIYGGNFCTYSDTNRFYSYRRDRKNPGRMASFIWISRHS